MKIKVEELHGLTIDTNHYKYGEVSGELSNDAYALVKKSGAKHSVVSENKSAETKPVAKDK